MAGVGLAIGVGVAAAASVGLSAYGASQQAGANESANRKNIRQASADRQLNYQMFQEGRGSEGSALLPLYAERNGQPFEPELFQDSMATYDVVTSLSPQQWMERYGTVTAALDPAIQGATDAVSGLYSGTTERELMQAAAPVQQARTELAESKASSAAQALFKTINEIEKINATAGFHSDGLMKQRLTFSANQAAADEIAQARIGARLTNAAETAGIRTGQIGARLNNVSLPYQVARERIAAMNLPADATLDRTARSQKIFQPFVIGPGQFRYDPLPPVIPSTPSGAIAATAGGQFLGALGSMGAAKYAAANQGGPVVNPYYGMNPGDVPYDYAGDPTKLSQRAYLN